MAGQHKHNPIPFRPAEGDRAWLLACAETTGRPVNAVLRQALSEFRQRHDRAVQAQKAAAADGEWSVDEEIVCPSCKECGMFTLSPGGAGVIAHCVGCQHEWTVVTARGPSVIWGQEI